MKNIIVILLLLLTLTCKAQLKYDDSTISNKIKVIVKNISKVNVVDAEFIGIAGTKSEQYKNFEQLKTSTTKELLMLTNHPNGAVRCYAFWALGSRPNIDIFKIVKDHFNDNEMIEYQSGCVGHFEKVGDFFISLVTPNYIDLDIKKINESQRKDLDSLLIYQSNELNAKSEAIENAVETPQLYLVLRDLYLKTHNQSAILKLSKYKRAEDIPLILSNRKNVQDKESGYYFTYKAIQNFPAEEFIPFLNDRVQETLDEKGFDSEWSELYSAIVIYKNQQALDLLIIPFSKVQHEDIKKYHLDFIYNAIIKDFDPIYSEVLWKIWEQEQNINLKGYEFYVKNNIKRAYSTTLKKLGSKNIDNDFSPKFDENIITNNLEESMLNLVLLNDKEAALKIIENKILSADVLSIPIYTAYVQKNKDIRFIDFLFQRFEKEWNTYVYLEIAKTLIKFEDKVINNRIIATLKINHKLTEDWGGRELSELLKENNIR